MLFAMNQEHSTVFSSIDRHCTKPLDICIKLNFVDAPTSLMSPALTDNECFPDHFVAVRIKVDPVIKIFTHFP